MNFELLNTYESEKGPVIQIKDHPLMDNIVISMNILDDGTADIALLETNDKFDMQRDIAVLETWVNQLFETILQYHKLAS